jgi:hypothetical protein
MREITSKSVASRTLVWIDQGNVGCSTVHYVAGVGVVALVGSLLFTATNEPQKLQRQCVLYRPQTVNLKYETRFSLSCSVDKSSRLSYMPFCTVQWVNLAVQIVSTVLFSGFSEPQDLYKSKSLPGSFAYCVDNTVHFWRWCYVTGDRNV